MGKKKRKTSSKRASKRRIKKAQAKNKQKKNTKKKQMVNPNIKKNSTNAKLVAVYGSLLSGLHNHQHLRDAEFVGEFWTEPSLKMFTSGLESYPYILKNGFTSVKMEVYEIDDDYTESALDHLEGVNSGLYKKDTIQTPHGEALYYVRTKKMTDKDTQILTGDWKDYKKLGT